MPLGEFTVLEDVEEVYNYKMIDLISSGNKSGVLFIFGLALFLQKKICERNLTALMKVSLAKEVFSFLEQRLNLGKLYLFLYQIYSDNQTIFTRDLIGLLGDEDNLWKRLVLNEIRGEFSLNFKTLIQSAWGLEILKYQYDTGR